MATIVVDLPAFGCLAPFSGVRDDALSTPDTATEIITDTVFQPIAVGTYGGGAYDPSVNVALAAIPDGATVTDVRYVLIAYRESGGDITPDPRDGLTPHAENEPFLYLDSSVRTPLFTLDDLPIGGYAGEVVSKAAESYSQLQVDHPLNRAWLSYHTSTSPPRIHVAYLAIRVTYTPASSVPPPCQLYPRDDDQGAGSGAIWPPGSSSRPGSYY